MAPKSLKQAIRERICLTAGLPSPHPTDSGWQKVPAPVAAAQSPTLPEVTDIAIIGSGITGTSVAGTLLSHPEGKGLRVTILDARGACSGATGRNGGHLISDTCGRFEELVHALGTEEAVKILRFSEANIAELKTLVSQLTDEERDAIELREVIATATFTDKSMAEAFQRSVDLLKETVKDTQLGYEMVYDQGVIKNKYKYQKGYVLYEQHGACALWPYRLITTLQKRLLDEYSDTFSIETHTPVTSISHEPIAAQYAPGYTLQTPRGVIRAKKVIHCTNGYSSYLLPNLTGKLYPLRGTMSIQHPGNSFPKLGHLYSWTEFYEGKYDPETRRLTTGLYYSQQNAKTGDIYIGGESQEVENLLTSDDSVVAPSATHHISSVVPKIYRDADAAKATKVWSGIMGFTGDHLPLAGQLNSLITGRSGNGEWIAAGYSGHGMDKAWLTGQAIAEMALGEDVPAWFPRSFLIGEERLNAITLDTSAGALAECFVPSTSKL